MPIIKYHTEEDRKIANREAQLRFKIRHGWIRKITQHKRTDDEIFEIAKRFTTLEDFRKSETSVYQISIKRGLIKQFTWLSRPFRWTRELCEAESHKYEGMGRSGFKRGNQGAYYASLNNGWIDSFTWLGSKQNPHTDKIYACYKYEFTDFHAVYVGLTMNPINRDYSHRTAPKGIKSEVFKFSESHKCDIPRMTILHKHLSCKQAQDCEDFYVNKFRRLGWNVLNKARTGVGVGSIGTTAFKWTKPKVFEEARKYLRRKHFEEGCSSAYEVARKNKWLDEMTWMPNPKERIKKAVEKKSKPTMDLFDAIGFAVNAKSRGWLIRNNHLAFTTLCKFGVEDRFIPVSHHSEKKKIEVIHANGTIDVFNSIKEAARFINGHPSFIRRCLKGLKKHHRGYSFRLVA